MKEWFTRGPRHMGDWLLLVAAGALVWRLFDVLPALAGFGQTLLGILSPFALGLVLCAAIFCCSASWPRWWGWSCRS